MFDVLRLHARHALDAWRSLRTEEVCVASDNTAFLPAALEVLETPPNPLGRLILWSILGFLVLALAWSILGTVDVVSVGEGKIVPRGQVKVIQAADTGVVRDLPVKEGQLVKAGDPLVVLDPTVTGADVEQARQALLASEIELNRARALADYASGKPYRFVAPEGVDPAMVAVQDAYLRQKVSEQAATMQSLQQQRQQYAHEQQIAVADGDKLSQQLPLVQDQLDRMEILNRKGFAPKPTVDQLKEQAIGMRQDILIKDQEAQKAGAGYAAAGQALATQRSKFAGEVLDELTKAEADYAQRAEELKKAVEHARLTVLRSPIDGYVQQLQVHTIGAVVKPADGLLIVVPKGAELTVEAQVPNREVGLLRVGQPVEIKVEAFPFTRYGALEGRLEDIGQDAVKDEKQGLLYTVRANIIGSPSSKGLKLDPTRLRTGMAVSIEVKTGHRRIIEYVLSPLARRVREAGRES